ncbi:MAG: serine-type D-Ala-D-Ala carboxypeptidase, partial [Betaproteobacteria bacterium]|nr:serine-type D-Ala-D-Ala carboxypeptidase [Betaproteobacteria bacterium]
MPSIPMLFRLAALLLLSALAQAQSPPPQPPAVVGRAWIVADLTSGQLLAAERPDERMEPAS